MSSDADWASLCQVMGRPALASDARFATVSDRKRNEDELEELVGAWTRSLSSVQVMTTLQEAGIASAVVNNFQGVCEDPQLQHRQHLRPMSHSEIGSYNVTSFPYRMSETPCVTQLGGPCLGEHNEQVICHLLGFSDEEFTAMHNDGVFK